MYKRQAPDSEELMAITSSGIVIRMPMSSITIYGRATQGVIVMKVDNGEKAVSYTHLKKDIKNVKNVELFLLVKRSYVKFVD